MTRILRTKTVSGQILEGKSVICTYSPGECSGIRPVEGDLVFLWATKNVIGENGAEDIVDGLHCLAMISKVRKDERLELHILQQAKENPLSTDDLPTKFDASISGDVSAKTLLAVHTWIYAGERLIDVSTTVERYLMRVLVDGHDINASNK